ncbi:MAG TPA: RNA methyltransferase [Anaerolineaceae bacterium]|nr:RNA methyltransferase [Anaerolineaceae bacterium]
MITSTANAQIQQIRKLRDRKERQQTGLFFGEGVRIVGEAVERGWDVQALIVAPELLTSTYARQLLKQADRRRVLEVSAEVFRSISSKDGPQGIAAMVRQRWTPLEQVRPKAGELWVALDSVADPGNLGTILRTHDAVGGAGVILLDHSTDPYDPSAIRASMGAVFSQQLVRASFEEFAAWKRRLQIPVFGTDGEAEADYHQVAYPDPMVLLMGSERLGLLEHHLALCDEVLRIPMVGRSDSLNLAVATGILLYEIFNQRRDRQRPAG